MPQIAPMRKIRAVSPRQHGWPWEAAGRYRPGNAIAADAVTVRPVQPL